MDLVVDQVVQLEHVDVADRCLLLHLQTGTTVDQLDLAVARQTSFFQTIVDDRFGCPVEDGRDGWKPSLAPAQPRCVSKI